jgi:hypothetical protein
LGLLEELPNHLRDFILKLFTFLISSTSRFQEGIPRKICDGTTELSGRDGGGGEGESK